MVLCRRLAAGRSPVIDERPHHDVQGEAHADRKRIATGLLARSAVLIVDEPGEALDIATAGAVMADIIDASRDAALLAISHRETEMRLMDEVVVMEQGRLCRRQ